MPDRTDLRRQIAEALAAFAEKPLRQAATAFFATLGYRSDRTLPIASVDDFCRQFDPDGKLNHPSALKAEWKSIEIVFQLTDAELSQTGTLFKETSVQQGLLQSYLFFAVELKGGDYARDKLTGLVRQLNRLFPMPVMVLIKHLTDKKPVLSIAVINRRQNQRDAARDVLGKVTIIRDISLTSPHRGHLDILASLAVPNLVHPQRLPINSFDTLHAAWEEIFNVELLNKRFYRELANWYFWALPQVEFPDDIEKDAEKRRATGLIRLLTRLIFCWFLKEKGLIPETLFAEAELKDILRDLSPDASTYHEAILQNLFFATLNQRMGKDAKGQPYRSFARDEGFVKNRATHGVDTLYRYEEHFRDPAAALDLFADVPFLNGGLFECLDRTDETTGRKLYLDGFSRNKKKRPVIPNHLFFGAEHEEDLSAAYGDKSRRREKVRGLLRILHSYKFTIVENTPIDQEIALDPELLGKVFENLLASYNEETKTTARKQTGSFYTPRPIVEYMVDESLKAHLARKLEEAHTKARSHEEERDEEKESVSEPLRASASPRETPSSESLRAYVSSCESRLNQLFSYTDEPHLFTESEVAVLLDAIHTCKILDPACGSGAFPMGMLQKLVYIIHKLDPDNVRWKQLQIDTAAKIPDPGARAAAIAAIERDFAENGDDYGRKLYLIENCLYGVDIQPIAIQITKLRFFISLVCDQRTNRSKKENHGIRPLPNLETKFVAADTLIGLPEMEQLALVDPAVYRIEAEIESLYHSHFAIQRRDQKLALQKKIKDLRQELARLLAQSLGSSKKAEHIAAWDPFDPQASADFFDSHWMFGRSLAEGFDVVIGNPPYVSYGLRGVGTLTKKERNELCQRFPNSAEYKISVYALFMERCISLCKRSALSSLIVPDSFLLGKYFSKIRSHILFECKIRRLLLIKERVFDNVTVGQSVIYLLQRERTSSNHFIHVALGTEEAFLDHADYFHYEQSYFSLQPRSRFRLFFNKESKGIIEAIDSIQDVVHLSSLITFRSGLIAKAGQATIKGLEQRGRFWAPGISSGGMVKRYYVTYEGEYLCYEPAKIKSGGVGTVNYKNPKLFVRQTGDSIVCGYDGSGLLALNNVHIGEGVTSNPDRMMYVCAVLNSSVIKFYYKTITLEEGRALSQIDIDMLDEMPIKIPSRDSEKTVANLVRFAILAQKVCDRAAYHFFDDLIDACVLECYFREHMAERDLLFLDDLAPHLSGYDPDASETQQRDFLAHLYTTLNAPASKIRNRLLRLTADSPDLLAVIKNEGKV